MLNQNFVTSILEYELFYLFYIKKTLFVTCAYWNFLTENECYRIEKMGL